MSTIANLDEQVDAVLIQSTAKQRAAEEAARGKQTTLRSAERKTSPAVAERDSSLDGNAREQSSVITSLPVWLL